MSIRDQIRGLHDLYIRERGTHYTTWLLRNAARDNEKPYIFFPNGQIAKGAEDTFRFEHNISKEEFKKLGIKTRSIANRNDLDHRGENTGPILIDNSTILHILRELSYDAERYDEAVKETQRLKNLYQRFESPDHYWSDRLQHKDNMFYIQGFVLKQKDALCIALKLKSDRLEFLLNFWMPWFAIMTFALIFSTYIIYALINS